MYFNNYKYFLTIVEYGGITRAAEALFLSQPAMSKYLSRLEQNLGIELFDRNSSPLKLTYAGRRYYEFIKRLEAMDHQFEKELNNIRNDDSGEIRMGIAQWRGSVLLPTIIPRFHETYPHVEINIIEGRAMQIETALIQGRVDLCLMNLPSHFPLQTNQEILWNEKCLLVGNREHPIVQEILQTTPISIDGYRNIDIHFLKNEDFISLMPGQNMTLATERIFSTNNLTPKSVWRTENMATALNMVSNTMSFTFMPEAGAKVKFLPRNLEYFSISHSKELFSFAAVYRKSFILNEWMRLLLDLTRQVYT
uniref:LysR family transcriptional regulator n=1 Tax=Ndongobacter massiliensis TaxID=1871025 RepID=UPI0009317CB0|nr:LysR family transcriptional regulator [Ndongobacter massiliensis]